MPNVPMVPVFRIIFVRSLQASILIYVLHRLLHWPITGGHAIGFVMFPVLCLYFLYVFIAQWGWGLPIIVHGPTTLMRVALTFDDGPSQTSTSRILAVLARYNCSATFFMVGDAVREFPQAVIRIVAAGHSVGVHGVTHASLSIENHARLRKVLSEAAQIVKSAVPEDNLVAWFRPPYGFKSIAMPYVAKSAGMRLVCWSVDSRDYVLKSATDITSRVLSLAQSGSIVLLHDSEDCNFTADALSGIIEGLSEKGYTFVTIDQLVSH